MKYILLFFCLGCTKIDEKLLERHAQLEQHRDAPAQARSAFQSRIFLGNDTTTMWTNSFRWYNYEAYLNVCDPLTQQFGTEVYQIAGPTQTILSWFYHDYKQVPAADNMVPGVYGFVAHGWVSGYSYCDDSTYNDNVYDTCWVTILKRRKKVNP